MPDPVEQLRLIHSELNRQRDEVGLRHKSIQDHATILIGAAGVSAGLQVANVPHLALLPVLVATIAAAAFGAVSIRLTNGPDIDISLLRNNVIGLDVYSAEYALVEDKIVAHNFDVLALGSRRRLVVAGFFLLAGSWLATLVLMTLNG